jgi:glycerophosphoryl diester phosphodiesterase
MAIKRSCPECIVMPDPGEAQNIATVFTAYEPKIIATDMDHLSKRFVEVAHQKGILVFTDDDEDDPSKWEKEWEKIAGWKTDGIQTDQPEELIKYLKSKQ